MDTDKLKALALAATPGKWEMRATEWDRYIVPVEHPEWGAVATTAISRENNARYIAAANPATVLALIAEVERLRADAERLDWMIAEECQIEHMDRVGAGPVYRVRWPWLEEQQREWSATPREAIDAAIAAKEPPCSS